MKQVRYTALRDLYTAVAGHTPGWVSLRGPEPIAGASPRGDRREERI